MNLTSRLAELMEDWKVMIGRDGVRLALPNIGQEIARLPYRHLRFLVLARLLSEPFPDLQPRIPLVIRLFEQGDLKQVRTINCPSEARQCARRLELGHKGLVALYQSQLAGYAWGCDEVNPELERVHIDLEPGDMLCNDMFTNPTYRGQGVHTALSLARFKLFRDFGFRRAICYIEVNNVPSLSVWQRKLGSLTVGYIDFIRIGTLYRVRCIGTEAMKGSAS